MNDSEKKYENQPEVSDELKETKEPTAFEDDLVKELEGIRDMLQTELDKATSENVDEDSYCDDTLIQELDEIEEQEDEAQTEVDVDAPICECCGEKPCSIEYGEDYPYCDDCRELMKASPLNVGGILAIVAMIVVAITSLFFCVKNVEDYTALLSAEQAYSQKKCIDAIQPYYSYLSTKGTSDNYSKSAARNLAKIFANLGYYSDAARVVEDYLTEFELSLPWNKKLAAIPAQYESFYATSNKITELLGNVLTSGEEFDYDEKAAILDKLLTEKDKNGNEYNNVFIEYYKYVLMTLSKKVGHEAQINQLQKIRELDGAQNTWIYNPNFVNAYAKVGDIENAEKYFNECMKINVQDSTLYLNYANAFRFSKNPDADKLLEIAKKAEENWPTTDNSYGYEQINSIAYLLKGDGKKAMQAIEKPINAQAYSISGCNLYALCALNVGDEEGYKKMVDVFKSNNMEIGKTIKKFKKGQMTIKQVLADNGGDI